MIEYNDRKTSEFLRKIENGELRRVAQTEPEYESMQKRLKQSNDDYEAFLKSDFAREILGYK